jgi:O-antigen/teichoic acid export membrane protein
MSTSPARPSAFKAARLMAGSTYVSFITGLLASTFVARSLGPDAYGLYAYIVWLAAVCIGLVGSGVNMTVIRFVAEAVGKGDLPQASGVHHWLRQLFLVGMAVVAMALLASAWLPSIYPDGMASSLGFYLIVVLVCAVTKSAYLFSASVSKGHGAFSTEAVSTSLIGIVTLAATGLLYVLDAGLSSFLCLFMLSSVAHPLIASFMLRRQGIHARKATMDAELKARVANALGWNIALAVVGLLSGKAVDTFLLGHYGSAREVGFYNIASSLTRNGTELLAAGLSSILLPFLARAHGEGGIDKVKVIFATSVRYYQFAGIFLAGEGFLLAGPVVRLLYGPAFDDVALALRVMVLTAGVIIPVGAYSAVFSATDNQKAKFNYMLATSVISVVCGAVFIPWAGYHGALVSCAVGNALTYTVISVVAKRTIGVVFPLRPVLGQWAAGTLAFGLAYPLIAMGSHIALAIAAAVVFALVYAVLTVRFKTWTQEDLDRLARELPIVAPLLKSAGAQ